MLDHFCFPEFNSNISIDSHVAYVFDQNCQYDIIKGANFLDKFGFSINYDDHTIKWVEHSISLKDPHEFFVTNMLDDFNDQLCQDTEEEIFELNLLDNYSARILDIKYEQVDINTVSADQKHKHQTNAVNFKPSWPNIKTF